MSEAIVLGSGTSSGVPVLGVQYPEAFLANERNHRTRPSLLIVGPEGNLLVDAGPDLRFQLLREEIRRVDTVIITHTHADHIMGMDDLRSFCLITKQPMPIYASPESQADIRRIFPYAFLPGPEGVEVPEYRLIDVQPRQGVVGIELRTFWVYHGPTPVLGLRVRDFAYLTDVNFIPDEAMRQLEGLDTLIMDAVRYRPHPNHYHYEKAIEVAQSIGARQTYFTHLSHDYDHDIVNSELPNGIQLAFDGLRIQL